MIQLQKNISIFIRIRVSTIRGFSLISAIFLLVVLAGLGVAMVSISTVQNTSSALDIQGVRAYQAAKAGIEWGLYMRLQPPNSIYCSSTDPLLTSVNGISFRADNIAMPSDASLAGFTVTVVCTPTGTSAVIQATACNMPVANVCPPSPLPNSPNYVQRRVEVRL
jgi:MSHA biogenesis protein MshP